MVNLVEEPRPSLTYAHHVHVQQSSIIEALFAVCTAVDT